MDASGSTKRFKAASGAPISNSPSPAARLPAYQPPPQIGSRAASRPSASIARPNNGATSLRLTVKAAPSKLRQATSGSPTSTSNPHGDAFSESDNTPAPVARTARSTRNPRTVVEPSSDEEDDDEEDDAEVDEDDEDEDDDDADGEVDDEILANEDSNVDADGEDDDMEDIRSTHPAAPVIKQRHAGALHNIAVAAPTRGPLKSVEDKEMEDDDDEDDELSELDSNGDEEEVEDEDEEDAEGESDDEKSRSGTPDLTKLTKRQRGQFEEFDVGLLALSNEAQKKKHLTAEEHAMRRAEMARRRKNLSEKRNEEEKMDTINKLLKKPAPKRRTRAEIMAAQAADADADAGDDVERPDPLYSRWANDRSGSRLGVPQEWLETPLGNTFRGHGAGALIEEIA